VKIFIYNISNANNSNKEYEKILSVSELIRYEKINSPKRKKEFLIGRCFLKKTLAENTDIKDIEIDIHSNGKPYLKNSEIKFNISHSKDMLVIALDNNEIGIDVEYINPKRNFNSLIKVFGNEIMAEYSKLSEDKKKIFFYKNWTIKEAYMKLTQEGFSKNIIYDEKVNFHTFQHEDYIVSVASF